MRLMMIFSLLVTLAGGCAIQQQQRQQAEFLTATTALEAELRSELDENRRLDPIRDKINIYDARNPTLKMLSLTSFPSEEERQALEEWQGIGNSFQSKARNHFQKYTPWAVPIYNMLRAAMLTLTSDLYMGKINYGQYNRQRQEIANKHFQALQERAVELQRQQAQTAAQQSIAASAAFAAFQNYLLGQQLINQQFQPARIAPFTCTRFGNITNCY